MALPATHFRFALAVAELLPVGDLSAYLAGTLYPDSRWFSGIDRSQTHLDECRQPAFARDDFHLGWYVHCVCDRVQRTLLQQRFSRLGKLVDEDRWICLSIAKMIQDMQDFPHTDIQRCLDSLDVVVAPNGEDVKKVRAYFAMIRKAYRTDRPPSPDTYHWMWLQVGLADELAASITTQLKAAMDHPKMARGLTGMFADMVDSYRQDPNRPCDMSI